MTGETYAIKSTGHNTNPTLNNVKDGVTMSLTGIKHVEYDPRTQTARIGTGANWEDAVKALEPYGVVPVGGRLGSVGVGGYLLGGGLSWLSHQYGWAMNNVVSFDVVLADGTILTASADQNADLYRVLKGVGYSKFGVVTSFEVKVFPLAKVCGSDVVFTDGDTDNILAAVHDFAAYNTDPQAAILPQYIYLIEGIVPVWRITFFYARPKPPADVFANFMKNGVVTDPKAQSYLDFLTDFPVPTLGNHYQWSLEMTPLPVARDPSCLRRFFDINQRATWDLFGSNALNNIVFHPITSMLLDKAAESGGDMWDLDRNHRYLIVQFIFAGATLDGDRMDSAALGLATKARELVLNATAAGTVPSAPALPLFTNYALVGQDVYGRLAPDKLALVKAAQAKYDPKGFFERKGFPIPV